MEESKMILGNFEMVKALYNFKATFAKTLSFQENDHFILHQTNTKQKNWWQVLSEKGEIGFIPSNYVEKVTVNPLFLLQFLDNCLINLQTDQPLNCPINKKELIERIKEKRRQTELNIQSNENDYEIVNNINSDSNLDQVKKVQPQPETPPENGRETPKKPASTVYIQDSSQNNQFFEPTVENLPSNDNLTSKSQSSEDITQQNVYDMVELVRANTSLSHEMSQIAVQSVIISLQKILPLTVSPHLNDILQILETSCVKHDTELEDTHDAMRLKHIFRELTYCKEDSQQRSWMLYEDEHVITEYISELISILSNADPNISKHVIAREQYYVVVTLIQYYQMEIRWSIRQLLLQAFGVMCSLDAYIVNIMLNSVLPMELARDMVTNPNNVSKLNYSSLLLTMIFSMGEQMPITHLEQLGVEYIQFILNCIEEPPENDLDDQIPDLFLNFVLAFNLQFKIYSDNVVMKALSQQTSAKIFTEKILLLFNREEDPVRIFEHEPAPPHSVLKLFNDMFQQEKTANLFYTNDTKVLIDIVVRQLSDLSPGEKKRPLYLELCRKIMRNTNYAEHKHRHEDIHKCFTRIFCEETEISKNDQKLVREISNEFPHLFK